MTDKHMLRLKSMQTWKVMEHAACAQHNILTHTDFKQIDTENMISRCCFYFESLKAWVLPNFSMWF